MSLRSSLSVCCVLQHTTHNINNDLMKLVTSVKNFLAQKQNCKSHSESVPGECE
jgi:hypothetical protein